MLFYKRKKKLLWYSIIGCSWIFLPFAEPWLKSDSKRIWASETYIGINTMLVTLFYSKTKQTWILVISYKSLMILKIEYMFNMF